MNKVDKNTKKNSVLDKIFKVILMGVPLGFLAFVAAAFISKPYTSQKEQASVETETVESVTEKDVIDYKYLDQFIDYLHNNSEAYDDVSEEFLIKEYQTWYTNKGYSNIIVNVDGRLEDASDDVSVYDIIPVYEEMPEGIYCLYGNGYSVICSIEYINEKHDAGIINISGYCSTGEQTNSLVKVFYKTDNKDFDSYAIAGNPSFEFFFKKTTQQLSIADLTKTVLENQDDTPEGYENYEFNFWGDYDFVYPYTYDE